MAKKNVPAWARGLDMSESERLAKSLGSVDPDKKPKPYRTPLRVNIRVNEGPSRTSNVHRGISLDVTRGGRINPLENQYRVVDILKAAGIKVDAMGPSIISIHATRDQDLDALHARVREALVGAGVQTY